MRRQNSLGGGPIMPGGSPYMLVANIDESIVNCLTWDMYKKGMLGRMLAVTPSLCHPVGGKDHDCDIPSLSETKTSSTPAVCNQ